MRDAIRRRMIGSVVATVVGAIAACGYSNPSVYVPEQADGQIEGQPASTFEVPPERPAGEVQVASFGVTEIQLDQQAPMLALHVRMVVENNSDGEPWQVTLADQQVEFPGLGRSGPMIAYAEGGAAQIVAVPPRDQLSIDLYYPVPNHVRNNADLPRFDLLWQVQADRQVASRAAFDRVEIDYPDYYGGDFYRYGWGPYWWYDPAFAYPGWGWGYPYGPLYAPTYIHVRHHGNPRPASPRPIYRDHRR